jgi:hypothetical protein
MLKVFRSKIWLVGIVALLVAPVVAVAAPVNLNTWTAESYPAVAGFGAGVWTVSPGGDSVFQSVNGQPTMFYSDFTAIGTEVRGRITVAGNAGDDDYIGFALGFQPGDTTNGGADYLLVDWKQATQFFDFGSPSNTPGSTAAAGLAVSRVTGVPTADEFWGHTDFATDPSGALTELQRSTNFGNVGYADDTTYEFRFVFLPNSLRVFVDGSLELDIAGAFSDGRMAFYNFSQAGVTYDAFSVDPAPTPEPATAVLLITGLLGTVLLARKRAQQTDTI